MKKFAFPFCFLILLCVSSIAGAQANLDSLYSIWQDTNTPDSSRVDAFKTYIWEGFLYSKPDSAFSLAEQMVSFSKEAGYPKGEAIGLRVQGIISRIKGEYESAIEYYQLSLDVAEQHGERKEASLAINNIGNVYYHQDNLPAALKYFRRSLKINEELGSKPEIALATNNIGSILFDQGNMPAALDYFQRSLKIREELNDPQGMAASLSTIGSAYSLQGENEIALGYLQRSLQIHTEANDQSGISGDLISLGNLYYRQQDFPKAQVYYEQSLVIAEALGARIEIANILNNIGSCFFSQNNFPTALEYYQRALQIRIELDVDGGIASSLVNIGDLNRKMGQYNLAIKNCKKGLALDEKIGNLAQQKEACTCLYETYKVMGKGNEALFYLETINTINDSLNAEATNKKLQQIEFAKELMQDSINTAEDKRVVEKAHQETLRKEGRTRNVLAVSGLILLLVAGGFYSRWRYVKRSRAVLQVEKDRSENLLLNILPEEIAEELKLHGRSEAREFNKVSILFTDFKGFTEASAKLSASELVSEINHCFEAFDGIMEKYHIEKIKTIGDAYMAAGGLPVPSDNAVKNTVCAALEMQAFIQNRKAENDKLQKRAFEMRVGIHTGPVVAGIVGLKKFQYDIWGDTVNTASRMESHGEVGEVNISQVTYDIIKDDPQFSFTSRGKIAAKGKGEVEMWFVSIISD